MLLGGVLNWHIDHYTLYFNKDHKNYLICYMPISKSSPKYSNVAIIPYNVLKKLDVNTYKKLKTEELLDLEKSKKLLDRDLI